jgi:hypothetical protein
MSALLDALITSIVPTNDPTTNALLLADPVHGMMLVARGWRHGHAAAETWHPPSLRHHPPQIPPHHTTQTLQDATSNLSKFNESLADLDFFPPPLLHPHLSPSIGEIHPILSYPPRLRRHDVAMCGRLARYTPFQSMLLACIP